MKVFPCYDCPFIGDEAPRCKDWKACKKYRDWLRGKGFKGLAIYVASIIVERHKAAQAGEGKQE